MSSYRSPALGFENGTICGPAESEYAQIDDHGRYNVKFKFDESDLKDVLRITGLPPHDARLLAKSIEDGGADSLAGKGKISEQVLMMPVCD